MAGQSDDPRGGHGRTPSEARHLRDLLTAALGYVQLIGRELARTDDPDRERLREYAEKARTYLAEMDTYLVGEDGAAPHTDAGNA